MDKILQQIENDFSEAIADATEKLNFAQVELLTLVAQKEEKKNAVIGYYEAIENKIKAEQIIENVDPNIKDLIK